MNAEETLPKAHPRPIEKTDADPVIITRLAVIFALALAGAIILVAVLFKYLDWVHPNRTSEAAPRVSDSDLPPFPRLQIHPRQDLEDIRAAEDLHLSRYAWIDQAHGVVQIPIERAMALWVQTQGAAAATNTAPSTNAVPAGVTELQMRQDKAKEAVHAP